MIRDRGKIKWTAMMLPEHVKLLRDWAEEDRYEQKPELDEQQIEEMNSVLCQAMEEGRELVITHYEAKHHKLLLGTIHHYDNLQNRLHIIDKFGGSALHPYTFISRSTLFRLILEGFFRQRIEVNMVKE